MSRLCIQNSIASVKTFEHVKEAASPSPTIPQLFSRELQKKNRIELLQNVLPCSTPRFRTGRAKDGGNIARSGHTKG